MLRSKKLKFVYFLFKRIKNKIYRDGVIGGRCFFMLLRYGYKNSIYYFHELNSEKKESWKDNKIYYDKRMTRICVKNYSGACVIHHSLTNKNFVFNDNLKVLSDNKDTLNYKELKSVYLYCLRYGDLRLAIYLRNQLIIRELKGKGGSWFLTKRCLNALLESHEYSVAKIRLKNKGNFFSKKYKQDVMKIINLCIGNKVNNSNVEQRDIEFHNYIRGKKVAIVGPAYPLDGPGSEIDMFDIVIRTNYRNGSNYPVEKFGKRTNISYYNHYRVSTYFNEVLDASLKIDWTLLKNEDDRKKINLCIAEDCHNKQRTFKSVKPLLFLDSDPMSIPNIIFDILNYDPLSVKLFCVNFFNSKNNYSKHYKKDINFDVSSQLEDIRIHEPFAGFRFVQGYYKNKIIEADDLTKSTLDLSVEEYAASLHEIFGSKGLHEKEKI